jgi:hypothetical protein
VAQAVDLGRGVEYYRDNIEEEYTGRRGVVRKPTTRADLEDLFKPPSDN